MTVTPSEIANRKATCWNDMQDITMRAEEARRGLTTAEVGKWESLAAELEQLSSDHVTSRQADLSRSLAADPESSVVKRSDVDGRERGDVRVLRPEQRMGSLVNREADPARDLSMSKFVRAIVLGDWSGIPIEARAMAVGTGSAGGFAVPDTLSSRVIDKARTQARVVAAGARTIPMESSTLKLARVSSDPSAAWKLESAVATASDMVLEQVTLTARTLMGYLKSSVELLEDSEEIEDTIENALAAALALELDRAALRGSGTPPEPRGIRNTTGVTIQSQGVNGAAFTNYNPISTAIQSVRAANGEPNAVIYSPRTAGTLDRLADSTGQPLRPPPSVEGIRQLVTAQLPENLVQGTATNASEAYVGEWSDLLIGVRRTLVIEASREASDATDSAFRQLQVHIRAWLRADFAVAQPSHFTVITGIIP